METQEPKIAEGKKCRVPPRRGQIKEKIIAEWAEKARDVVGWGRENTKSEGKSKGGRESGSPASITHPSEGN
ncbi:hypothetical protein RHMOL_Rhmol12G0157500 [Rhododendron molle]|uniref:Uncharacterized protein n=1 Tax=Rhododendron molle TaxID=49168 RepID=A0ACC0LIW2_RHOML|nr:hypothetical protein RHMOL_Rhmol12G0157500 [Rhododendron molle]